MWLFYQPVETAVISIWKDCFKVVKRCISIPVFHSFIPSPLAPDKGKNEEKLRLNDIGESILNMKIISVAAVTAGGKTTVVNELKKRLRNSRSLHFGNYTFECEVDNFYQWVLDGANYNVWNLSPLEDDILSSSDHVIDGTLSVEEIVNEIVAKMDYRKWRIIDCE